MGDIWQLYRLQQLDNKMADLQRKLNAISSGEDSSGEVDLLEQQLEELNSTLRNKEKELKEKEYEVQKFITQRKSFEKKLYGGESGNPKELAGWQQEIDTLKKKQSTTEDSMLMLMEEIETLDGDVKERRKELEDRKEEENRIGAEKDSKLQELQHELTAQEQKKEKIIETIEAPLMETYRDLYERRDGVVIVKIIKGNCGGCFINLPESLIKRVQRREVEFCSNCGRILFADGE